MEESKYKDLMRIIKEQQKEIDSLGERVESLSDFSSSVFMYLKRIDTMVKILIGMVIFAVFILV